MPGTRPRITVVGGANTDVVGMPDGVFVARDSNPGHTRVSPGGVARNVAENLARLGAEVRFITAFGADAPSAALEDECRAAGIDTTFSVRVPDVPGCSYLAVMDETGDLVGAINDMRALAALTPQALAAEAFVGADAVVLDTNLGSDTIARAVALAGDAPVVLDPVSTVKGPRASDVLSRLGAIKANRAEAELLAGTRGAREAAEGLTAAGVRWAFVTLGAEGAWCASAEDSFGLAPADAVPVNATGAGDAFTAGIAWGIATGLGIRQTAALARRLSGLALESERTVSERGGPEVLRADEGEGQR
jgi:pseudouridine kinase